MTDDATNALLAEARRFLQQHAKRRVETKSISDGDDTLPVIFDASPVTHVPGIEDARGWRRLLHSHGLSWVDGPVEMGGRGLDAAAATAFADLEAAFDVPDQTCFFVGLSVISPTLAAFGTTEQKSTWIPRLRGGDAIGVQLFSEPDFGSDLAGVQTRAVETPEGWRVTGQKVWSSFAQYSDVGLLLARTDAGAPKHSGLTMFLVDMRQEGIEIRPLRQMTGGADFNEVFLTDVLVPDSMRVGDRGDGWLVARAALQFERQAVGSGHDAPPAALIQRLLTLAEEVLPASGPTRAIALDRLAATMVLAHTLDAVNSCISEGDDGVPAMAHPSTAKLMMNDFLELALDLGIDMIGPAAAHQTGEPDRLIWGQTRLGVPGQIIAGGTPDIQRNILSERVLGMPRENVRPERVSAGPRSGGTGDSQAP